MFIYVKGFKILENKKAELHTLHNFVGNPAILFQRVRTRDFPSPDYSGFGLFYYYLLKNKIKSIKILYWSVCFNYYNKCNKYMSTKK